MDMGLKTHVRSSAIIEMGACPTGTQYPCLLLPENGHGFENPCPFFGNNRDGCLPNWNTIPMFVIAGEWTWV